MGYERIFPIRKLLAISVAAELILSFSNAYALPPCSAELKKGDRCEEKISRLRPTQPEVGFDEIEDKVERYSKLKKSKLEKLAQEKNSPVVIAPDGGIYLIDHHHSLIALEESGLEHVPLRIFENWSTLGEGLGMDERMKIFWKKMQDEKIGWYELENGLRLNPLSPEWPKRLSDCKNSRMRSVVYRLFREGNLKRELVPYFEFYVAQAFREAGFAVREGEIKEVTKKIKKFLAEKTGGELIRAVRCRLATSHSGAGTVDTED